MRGYHTIHTIHTTLQEGCGCRMSCGPQNPLMRGIWPHPIWPQMG